MNGEYNQRAWFWEFVKMFIKLLLMWILTFFEYDIPNKVSLLFSLTLFELYVFFVIISDLIYFLRDDIVWTAALLHQAL